MKLLDFVEIWLNSLRNLFESAGMRVVFNRSTGNRPKHSCHLNLRDRETEVDFLVWESGEAELIFRKPGEQWVDEHIEGLRDPNQLGATLSRIVELVL